MGMLLTTLAFLVITGLLMRAHVRKSRRHADAGTAARRACPRCRAPLSSEAVSCPACGAPLSAFELVGASTASAASAATDSSAARPHAVVRADVCVGCGTCVAACPETGAIQLVGKLAVVNKTLCVGHGKCVEACPVSAIVLATGAAVHRVEVPDINTNFETNVPGLYIVGELGGRGLIKNAINEGKLAIEHITAHQRRAGRSPAADPDEAEAGVYDVVIVGAGPAGLSAALQAHAAQLRYAVLEQGSIADTIRKYPRSKLLLAEPVRVPLYGDLWIADASKEALLAVWEKIIAATGLRVRTGQRVLNVTRQRQVLHVETADAVYRAHSVVLAMGRRGTPRRLGVPGEELGKVVYDIAEMEAFAGQQVLVVGGGDSAVESALGLSRQPGTTVTLSYRGESFARVKERNQQKLDAAVRAGQLRVQLKSQVREVRARELVLDVGGSQQLLPNDAVIVRIGGEPPQAFLEKLGVRIVKKDVPLQPSQEAVVA